MGRTVKLSSKLSQNSTIVLTIFSEPKKLKQSNFQSETMSAIPFPLSGIRSTQSEGWGDQHTMVHTIGKMLDVDVQRIGAPRSTIFLAADFEIQLPIEKQMEQTNLDTNSSAVDDELDETMMDLGPAELLEETAAVPTDAIGTSPHVSELQRGDEHIEADEYVSEDNEDSEDSPAIMRRLNPNVDRTYALRSEPDESKLCIQLVRPNGRIKTHRYSHPVDWTQPLSKLNIWRNAIFRRYLGPLPCSLNPGRMHRLEIQYLVDAPNYPENRHSGSRKSNINWAKVEKAFNERFQGKLLPGCPIPRPARTMNVLSNALWYYTKGGATYYRAKRQRSKLQKTNSRSRVARVGKTNRKSTLRAEKQSSTIKDSIKRIQRSDQLNTKQGRISRID